MIKCMAGELINISGTRPFVDGQGEESAPALLFIHGGPSLPCCIAQLT